MEVVVFVDGLFDIPPAERAADGKTDLLLWHYSYPATNGKQTKVEGAATAKGC